MEVGIYTTTPEVEASKSEKSDKDKKKDKDKADSKETSTTSEEGQETESSVQSSGEDANPENSSDQGESIPAVGQETSHQTSPGQG